MMEISKISSIYDVRRLDDSDTDDILCLCQKNTQFYEYCEAEPTREQVLSDLHITPPGIGLSDKYYIGFYKSETLIAVMDLIDGYPEPEIAFIGFFMMNKELQGQGIGTEIIRETASYLKTAGKTSIRLAIDKGNPQSTHFWKKNGFTVIKEVDRNGWTALVAEKNLRGVYYEDRKGRRIYEFDAIIHEVPDNGGAYVVFPWNIREEFGKGRVKVNAEFDGIPYEGSIVNMGVKDEEGNVCYVIGVQKAIRKQLNKGDGSSIHIMIRERV